MTEDTFSGDEVPPTTPTGCSNCSASSPAPTSSPRRAGDGTGADVEALLPAGGLELVGLAEQAVTSRDGANRVRQLIAEARPLPLVRKHNPEPPAQQWLTKHWLPADRLAMLTREGGAGKSRLALQLAAAIAAGHQHWMAGTDQLCHIEALGEGAPVV